MFNFKKIASVVSSGLMIASTAAIAVAANYPAPFVQSGSADVALVYGSTAASSDLVAAIDISNSLQAAVGGDSGDDGGDSFTGEVYPLFTSATELFLNDSINKARSIVTDQDLPTILADGDFSGNVEADYTQTITLNGANRILFGEEPDSDSEPTIYLDIGTTAGAGLYNTTITFDKAVNFTHVDSKSETLNLFGEEWTVGSDTTTTELVLYKSSEKISLSLGGASPSASQIVEVDGESYTVELIAGSDTDATIKVTDSSGNSESKEIDEGQSKKVNDVEIALTRTDESEALGQVTVELTVASDKVSLTHDSQVQHGADDDSIEGTLVSFIGTNSPTNITGITIQVFVDDSDLDAVIAGETFEDPAFGSFRFDFKELNVPMDSDDREDIVIDYNGDDSLQVTFTNHQGHSKSVQWYENGTAGGAILGHGSASNERIKVFERAQINRTDYVVVGNEEEGFLLQLTAFTNTTGYDDDEIKLKDIFSGEEYTSDVTAEGSGTIAIDSKSYSFVYSGSSSSGFVRLNYPDSTSNNLVLFPTIETSKGAKVSFVQPTTINLSSGSPDHGFGDNTNVTGLVIPDGDEYASTFAIANMSTAAGNSWIAFDASTFVDGPSNGYLNGSAGSQANITVGTLKYELKAINSSLRVRLLNPSGLAAITVPNMVIWEESEDANDREHALVVTGTGAGTSSSETEVDTVTSTAGLNGAATYTTLSSDDDLSQLTTLYGSMVQLDDSSDPRKATISYPDDQVEARIYIAESEASISGGSSSGGSLGSITVKDNEVSQVSSKNLIVLGGSCINTVAASLLGSDRPLCGADFTAQTGVSSGEFLIQSFTSPSSSSKVALLVAGFNAADTTNAAKYLTTQTVDTTVGKKYKGTSSTSAELIVE